MSESRFLQEQEEDWHKNQDLYGGRNHASDNWSTRNRTGNNPSRQLHVIVERSRVVVLRSNTKNM